MSRMLRATLVAVLAVTVALPNAIALPQDGGFVTNVRGIDRRNMDETVGACVDFYRYANGNRLANNPIPAERSRWSTGSELQERNYELLKAILEEAADATSAPRGSTAQKVGDFYASAMDTARLEREGAEPLAADLVRIDAIDSVGDLQRLVIDYHRQGYFIMFGFGVLNDLVP